jgi:trehalose/maltose hydrolase-like predicted phosphorylase
MIKRYIPILLFFFMAIGIKAQDPWRIEVDSINPENYYGATVGNGQLGLVSSPEPLKVSRVVLGGVYDIYGNGRVNNFVHGINMLDLEVKIDGSTVRRNNIKNYVQAVNMRDGMFECSFDHPKANVKYRYTALRQLPYSCIMEVTVTPICDIRLSAENIITVHESMNGSTEFFTTVQNGIDEYNIATTTVFTPTKRVEIGASSTIIPDPKYTKPIITPLSNRGTGIHSQKMVIDLKAGTSYTFYVLGSTISNLYQSDVRNELERLNLFLAVEGPARLIKKHTEEWHKLWESDIVIEGDAQSQQDVHNMLFNIYSTIRENSGLSTSPMGLTGFGYNGHVFWDCETWVYPVMLVMHPELAKTLLDYRYNRLEAAKKNAYTYGYSGAKFPWESSSTGYEDIPSGYLYGADEVHVNADIAIAAWQYYQVTKDLEWLKEKGFPIIKECADFWVSRVDSNENGTYDLINVIGPDERNVNDRKGKNVKNNAYTIGAATTNLRIACKAAKIVGEKANPQWTKVADGLSFTRFPNGVIKEHEGYIDNTPTKQIDVGLLAYPLNILTDKDDIKKNLEYYINTVPRKTTPAMSKSVYSIIYSQLGDKDKAWNYFQDSYLPNLNPPFRVIAEFDGGTNPYFITGAGGTLQAVLMGFGGLRITDNGIVNGKASVPESWTGFTLKGIGPDKITLKLK